MFRMTFSHFDSSLCIFSPFRQFHTANLVNVSGYYDVRDYKTLTIFYKFKNIRSIDRWITHNNKTGQRVKKVKYGKKGSKGQIWSKKVKRSNMVKKGQKGPSGSAGPTRIRVRVKTPVPPRLHHGSAGPTRVHPRFHPGSKDSKGQKVKRSNFRFL